MSSMTQYSYVELATKRHSANATLQAISQKFKRCFDRDDTDAVMAVLRILSLMT